MVLLRELELSSNRHFQSFETSDIFVVFGDRSLHREDLEKCWPNYRFHSLHQVHGTKIVKINPESSSSGPTQADGHYTNDPGQALMIRTADCLPVILASRDQVMALHCGWRGVANGILQNAQSHWTEPVEFAWIGPHIQSDSFEVGRDVAEVVYKSAPVDTLRGECMFPHARPEKVYLDLQFIVSKTIGRMYPEAQIHRSEINTFTHPGYHSFRRDGESAGRQFSFVVLKS